MCGGDKKQDKTATKSQAPSVEQEITIPTPPSTEAVKSAIAAPPVAEPSSKLPGTIVHKSVASDSIRTAQQPSIALMSTQKGGTGAGLVKTPAVANSSMIAGKSANSLVLTTVRGTAPDTQSVAFKK